MKNLHFSQDQLVTYMSFQLDIDSGLVEQYKIRRETIDAQLSPAFKERLDSLLQTDEKTISPFHQIKTTPQKPSVAGMRLLSEKLSMIEQTGALTINLNWMNNNYKRHLSNYAINSDAYKLRELTPMHRYASLICFLQDAYQDVIDHIFDMYSKALTSVHSQAETRVNNYNKEKRGVIRSCLIHHKKLCSELLAIADGSLNRRKTTVLPKLGKRDGYCLLMLLKLRVANRNKNLKLSSNGFLPISEQSSCLIC